MRKIFRQNLNSTISHLHRLVTATAEDIQNNRFPKPVRIESVVLALLRNHLPTVDALEETEWLSKQYGLQTADMPMLITTLHYEKAIHDAARKKVLVKNPEAVSAKYVGTRKYVDTTSGEYLGWRNGKLFYEGWHGLGSLSNPEGLRKGLSEQDFWGFMPVYSKEWDDAGKGKYRGEDVIRIHVDDAFNGDIPPPGTPYMIFACLYEDPFSGNWKLNDDGPEVNDNLLILAGGIKPLERYCDLILKSEEEGGEGFSSIKTHPLSLPSRAKPEIPAKGRLLRLMRDDRGILGRNEQVTSGRFAAVNREYFRGAVTSNGIENFVETYPEKKAIPICEYYSGAEIDVTDAKRALFLGSTKKTDGDRLFAESPLETIVYGPPQNIPRTFYGNAHKDTLDFVIRTYQR